MGSPYYSPCSLGKSHYRDGLELEDNPYQYGTEDYDDWEYGWWSEYRTKLRKEEEHD